MKGVKFPGAVAARQAAARQAVAREAAIREAAAKEIAAREAAAKEAVNEEESAARAQVVGEEIAAREVAVRGAAASEAVARETIKKNVVIGSDVVGGEVIGKSFSAMPVGTHNTYITKILAAAESGAIAPGSNQRDIDDDFDVVGNEENEAATPKSPEQRSNDEGFDMIKSRRIFKADSRTGTDDDFDVVGDEEREESRANFASGITESRIRAANPNLTRGHAAAR